MTEPKGQQSGTTTVLRHARTVDRSSIVDLTVTDGIIAAVEPSTERTAGHHADQRTASDRGPARGVTIVDLGGRLVLPAPAEPHAHLDKALLADEVVNSTGDLNGAIDAMDRAATEGRLSHDAVVERATSAVEMLVARGTTEIRSHIDVGDGFGTAHIGAVTEVRDRFGPMVDLELVALAHSPVTGAAGAGNRRALAEAIEAGVDVVGGCPHLEDDPEGSIDLFLDVATEAGLGIDLHMDETLDPSVFHLDYLARRVLDTGFDRPVAASHSVTLGLQDVATQRRTARLLAEAGVAVVALPQTNLFLQGRDHPVATPRALTPVAMLQEAGVTVAAGGDNVQDPFNPMGRGDQLEIANLIVLTAHRSPEVAYDMVANQVRRVMGRPPVAVAVGSRADLVALPATGIRHGLAAQPYDRLVFRAGRLVASSAATTTVHHHSVRPDNR